MEGCGPEESASLDMSSRRERFYFLRRSRNSVDPSSIASDRRSLPHCQGQVSGVESFEGCFDPQETAFDSFPHL